MGREKSSLDHKQPLMLGSSYRMGGQEKILSKEERMKQKLPATPTSLIEPKIKLAGRP